jgi:hypothetical protein
MMGILPYQKEQAVAGRQIAVENRFITDTPGRVACSERVASPCFAGFCEIVKDSFPSSKWKPIARRLCHSAGPSLMTLPPFVSDWTICHAMSPCSVILLRMWLTVKESRLALSTIRFSPSIPADLGVVHQSSLVLCVE